MGISNNIKPIFMCKIIMPPIKLFLLLIISSNCFSQTETFDIATYKPPKNFKKDSKQGVVTYTHIANESFCVITIYASRASAGDEKKDFSNEWKDLAVTPHNAEANPKTETQTSEDGWKQVSAATRIKVGSIDAIMILNVCSGFGKKISVSTISNNRAYFPLVDSFLVSFELDKTKAVTNLNPTVQIDPFPDRPGYHPQKPLSGTLKASITMADLVGTWDHTSGSVQTYIDSYTGDYSHTNTIFYGQQYLIKRDGSFTYKFTGRSDWTVRESDKGSISISGGYITLKFDGKTTNKYQKYQIIAFMTQPSGTAIISLVEVHDDFQGYFGERAILECGHSEGYIHCVGGEEWVRLITKPVK